MEHLKRLTTYSVGQTNSKRKTPQVAPERSIMMRVLIESPPLVFIGNAQHSSGALLSGRLFLNVLEPVVTIERFKMQLLRTTTVKKSVAKHCQDCTSQNTELESWNFLGKSSKLSHGEHNFPFSCLVSGHLPTTTHGTLGVIDYHLVAEAVTSTGETIQLRQSIDIRRAIGLASDEHVFHVFTPNKLTARCTYPPIIHTTGDFLLNMRLEGVITKLSNIRVQLHLRKLVWRIEEHQKVVSIACPKHAVKAGPESKSVSREDTRIIGQGELNSGWKFDFDNPSINVEFPARVDLSLRPNCDVDSSNGLSVNHTLVVDMTVKQEWSVENNPRQMTAPGEERVLRTRFHVTVTDAGDGIAWDEEQPPNYEEMPGLPVYM